MVYLYMASIIVRHFLWPLAQTDLSQKSKKRFIYQDLIGDLEHVTLIIFRH